MSANSPFRRLMLIVLVGMGTLFGAAQWVRSTSNDDDLVVDAVPREAPGAVDVSPAAPADLPVTATSLAPPERTRAAPDSKGNAFAVLDWTPPPPPAVVIAKPPPPPPPTPVAPPLPFTFVGMLEKGAGQPQAFLAQGELLLVVAAGDTLLNNTYRVDSLSAQQILITYLPLNTQQTLTTTGRPQ